LTLSPKQIHGREIVRRQDQIVLEEIRHLGAQLLKRELLGAQVILAYADVVLRKVNVSARKEIREQPDAGGDGLVLRIPDAAIGVHGAVLKEVDDPTGRLVCGKALHDLPEVAGPGEGTR
jgi:hypothetical protein